MSNVLNNSLFVISSFFISCVEIYSLCILNKNKKKLYVSIIILSIFGAINHLYVNAFVKMIIVSFLFCICSFIIFNSTILECIISSLFTLLLIAISDTLSVLLLYLIFNNLDFVRNGLVGVSLGNMFVGIILFFVCRFKFIRFFYVKLVNFANNIRIKNLFRFYILIVVSINFLLAVMYYKMNSIVIMFINLFLLLIYSYIVYRNLSEKNNSLIVQTENKSLMTSLHQYEDMVDRQRVDNHENKNQLLIIKNMIKKNDKDVVKYIDTIVKDKKEDDEALYTRVMTIPSGGLQGIIYQKMLVMKDEHIKFSLDVGRGVREIELNKLSMEDNYNLCKIMGVLLDNAIEESLKIKDKRIMISLYVDECMLIIEVSNKFEGKIDIDSIDDKGFTTKGDGHGYGLSLVKSIVSDSDIFFNERKICRKVFKQIVKVKIKKA